MIGTGYGVKVSDYNISLDKMKRFLNEYPDYKEMIEYDLRSDFIYEPVSEDYHHVCWGYGMAFILSEIILIETGIDLHCLENDADNYLLYMPPYPWECEDNKLTSKDLSKVIKEYMSKITDEQVIVKEYNVETWG